MFRELFKPPANANPISVRLAALMALLATLAVVLLGLYALQERSLAMFAVGAFVAMATTAVASVGGFLLGLPRYSPELNVPVSGATSPAQSATTAADKRNDNTGAYTPSNNLEQVSDWLTKLLLGAGLVQLGHLSRWLGSFVNGLANAFSRTEVPPPAAKVLAGSLIGFYTAFGFLIGYVMTTTWYREVLRHKNERA